MAKVIIEIEVPSKMVAVIMKPLLKTQLKQIEKQQGINSVKCRIED